MEFFSKMKMNLFRVSERLRPRSRPLCAERSWPIRLRNACDFTLFRPARGRWQRTTIMIIQLIDIQMRQEW
jgi:hypothetical protein